MTQQTHVDSTGMVERPRRTERSDAHQRTNGPGAGTRAGRVLALQRSAGNQAVAEALSPPGSRYLDGPTTAQRQGDRLASTGASLASGLVPASFATPRGLPALRYNMPNIPVATATVVTPNAVVSLELLLRGNIQATPTGSLPGISIDQTGFRVQADSVVDGLNRGMRINGIGGGEMSVGTTWGTDLETNEVRFTPPNRFAYIGQTAVDFDRQTAVGIINFRGQLGFELRATIVPLPLHGPRATEPTWWERNWKYVVGTGLLVGAGLLVVGTIVEDVVTGGAGIADDPASFAAAGAMATAGAAAF